MRGLRGLATVTFTAAYKNGKATSSQVFQATESVVVSFNSHCPFDKLNGLWLELAIRDFLSTCLFTALDSHPAIR